MPRDHQVIHIHPGAPAKPPLGAPCNGCGVCCLAEPCPAGMLVSRKRHGACDALVWSEASDTAPARYQCGLMLRAAGPEGPDWRAGPWWRRVWLAWVRRLISAGSGCDASLDVLTQPDRAAPADGVESATK
ncbi:hypothetical protein [Aquabacterium sp.]|uniref:hypothetical protein n=1 Tax=Aquabacterium sp. TaxID=1872578 RepID=UPI001D66C10F|nr:hypothetical protein [Aquabacterium sp.]MBT9608767.1 hypothetical protein [Aquabacterium sp.]